jgi:hypothetical protein
MKGESRWPLLAKLPLVIEACEYERLHAGDLPANPLTPRPEASGFRWAA